MTPNNEKKPIILTADFHVENKVIPAGTVGIPAVFRSSKTETRPNSYRFPAFKGPPPLGCYLPFFPLDVVERQALFERLEPTDPRVLAAEQETFPEVNDCNACEDCHDCPVLCSCDTSIFVCSCGREREPIEVPVDLPRALEGKEPAVGDIYVFGGKTYYVTPRVDLRLGVPVEWHCIAGRGTIAVVESRLVEKVRIGDVIDVRHDITKPETWIIVGIESGEPRRRMPGLQLRRVTCVHPSMLHFEKNTGEDSFHTTAKLLRMHRSLIVKALGPDTEAPEGPQEPPAAPDLLDIAETGARGAEGILAALERSPDLLVGLVNLLRPRMVSSWQMLDHSESPTWERFADAHTEWVARVVYLGADVWAYLVNIQRTYDDEPLTYSGTQMHDSTAMNQVDEFLEQHGYLLEPRR